MPLKLGKLAPKVNPKTLNLSKYVIRLPDPPNRVWYEYKVRQDWGMMGNDQIGDCTCAAIAHMLMLTTAHTGAIVVPTDQDVIQAYSTVSGYNPQTGLNDNGAAITDVLNYWREVGIAGHKILGWAQIDHTNLTAVRQAIWLFGGINIGIQVPASAMDQFNQGMAWGVVADDGGIEGGHSIPNFGYGSLGTNCISWGRRQGMTWEWFKKYCDEAYAVVTQDWINAATGKTLGGFDLATLSSDLNALSH